MDKYQETFDTWNNIASLYNEKFMDLELYNATYDHICNEVTTNWAKILDIGCGPGNITRYLLTKRPDFEILGIDIAPNMIELAKLNNPTAHFAVMDSRGLLDLNMKFDAIIVGFCLPYLSDVECRELIANASKLLNDHGLIYLSFVAGDPKESDYKTGAGGRVYFQYHRLDDLIAELKKQRFIEMKTFEVKFKTSGTSFDIHTIITAKKEVSQ